MTDWHFDAWCYPITNEPRAIIDMAVADVEGHERHKRLRQRARTEIARRAFTATVTAILSDMMRHRSAGRSGGICVPRSKRVLGNRSRYRPAALGETLPGILDMLEATGWIEQDMGGRKDHRRTGRRTTIYPGQRLMAVMDKTTIGAKHFRSDDREEVIILGRSKLDFWDGGERIEYEDTEATRRFRDEMRAINEWLDKADLKSFGNHDTSRRRLRRSFTRGRFDSGGRLFGGFWQGMSKATRRERIVIESEDTTELDYGQMGVRILYCLAGTPAPIDGDLYAIPGFEKAREGVKKVMSAMVFADSPLDRKPKGTAMLFDPDASFATIRDAILTRHGPIAHLFHTGTGHHAQFIESQIMVSVLLRLRELGVVALPIHDAIIVGDRHADVAETVMLDTFASVVGQPGIVSQG